MRCPRCESAVHELLVSGGGGAYRGSYHTAHRCGGCGLTVFEPRDGSDMTKMLSRSPLVRGRKAGDLVCGECLTEYEQLTLSWDDRWLEIDECASCGRVALDPGEREGLEHMVRGSQALAGLGEFLALEVD